MQGAHPYTLGVAVLFVRDVAIVLEEVPPDFRSRGCRFILSPMCYLG